MTTYFTVKQRRKWTSENWNIVSYFDFDSDNLAFLGPAILEDKQLADHGIVAIT
jgi:hypothetical protein